MLKYLFLFKASFFLFLLLFFFGLKDKSIKNNVKNFFHIWCIMIIAKYLSSYSDCKLLLLRSLSLAQNVFTKYFICINFQFFCFISFCFRFLVTKGSIMVKNFNPLVVMTTVMLIATKWQKKKKRKRINSIQYVVNFSFSDYFLIL